MPPRRNTANSAGATANATTNGQVVMDTLNVPPAIAQVVMDDLNVLPAIPNLTANSTPPISQNVMAAPTIGIPPFGQNMMAAPNVVPGIQNASPPFGQNAMAALTITTPPVCQNAMACPNGATQWTSQEAAWMSVPSLSSAPPAMMNCSNANGKKSVNYPRAST
eukprot:678885-Rhodomonas_salina.3